MARPPIRKMIKDAVKNLHGGRIEYSEIRDHVLARYGSVNRDSINDQIAVCTVNHPSRVHYPENSKPRAANDQRYDFLYMVGLGQVEWYDPKLHGVWEIRKDENGDLIVVITATPRAKRKVFNSKRLPKSDMAGCQNVEVREKLYEIAQ